MTKITIEVVGEDDQAAVEVVERLAILVRDSFDENKTLSLGYSIGRVDGNCDARVTHE